MAFTKVIIVGGGFGGLNLAKHLKNQEVDVLLIDKTNHHLFQPLLYQVATAGLSVGNIAFPIREVLKKEDNVSVIMGEVKSVDLDSQEVFLSGGVSYPYHYLVLSPGSRHSYFGRDDWEKFAPGLKTASDAVRIRERILLGFERAERADSFEEAKKFLSFIVIGGGPTGVEMAGAIAEIAHKSLFKNFRKIKPEHAKIFLLEGQDDVLPSYPEKLRKKAREDLKKLGVTVLTSARVVGVEKYLVTFEKDHTLSMIHASNIIWACGNEASSLLKELKTSFEPPAFDHQGRILVDSDLSIPHHDHVFVIGDAAAIKNGKGELLPALAPVAVSEAKYVAEIIAKKIPKPNRAPYHYKDKGYMATIGKSKAVAVIGRLKFSGFLAWWAWSFIHIATLISFRNRLIVMMQWIFWYLTGLRNVRIITRPVYDDQDSKEKNQDGIPASSFPS